jgi:predicted kinase
MNLNFKNIPETLLDLPTVNAKPTFTMLVGVPGSGKTTYAKSIVSDKVKHFSSDAIRAELWGDENCQKEPSKVFSLMHERTLEALRDGYDVIYDATNISRKNRKVILDLLPTHVTKKCTIVWAPIFTCVKRDLSRKRTVGVRVIESMIRRFEAPFYDEGFDYINVHITAEFDEDKYYSDALSMMNIPHDNPHHSVNVYEHCMLCGENLMGKDVPDMLKFAAFVHDVGKPFTKTFVNKKGETTDVAHYYDHQAVGAWISYGFPGSDPTLAWAISSHMAPFINQKYYNSLDPLYKEWITLLHTADKEAH